LVGEAEKVTSVPGQIVVGAAAIETAGTTIGVTVIAGAVDVTVRGAAQSALEVMVTVTTSPGAKVVMVNTEEFAPTTLTPLTCH